jgi:transposase
LGPAFAGVLVRDGWAPYEQFTAAAHQSCLGHVLRRCCELQAAHPRALLPGQVEEVLQEALAVRDRHAAGAISTQGATIARGRLIERLTTILSLPTRVPAIQRFIQHLDRQWIALSSFLFTFTIAIDPTNWRAEQAIRWAVITRKVNGGGNRRPRGAVTQYVLASVLQTARQRGLDRHAVLVGLLRSPTPIVSPELQPPAAPH